MKELVVIVVEHIGMGSAIAAIPYHPVVLIECPVHNNLKPVKQEFCNPDHESILIDCVALCPGLSEAFVIKKILQHHPYGIGAIPSPKKQQGLMPVKTWYHPLQVRPPPTGC